MKEECGFTHAPFLFYTYQFLCLNTRNAYILSYNPIHCVSCMLPLRVLTTSPFFDECVSFLSSTVQVKVSRSK